MAILTRAQAKLKFQSKDKPTEQDFADLFDSTKWNGDEEVAVPKAVDFTTAIPFNRPLSFRAADPQSVTGNITLTVDATGALPFHGAVRAFTANGTHTITLVNFKKSSGSKDYVNTNGVVNTFFFWKATDGYYYAITQDAGALMAQLTAPTLSSGTITTTTIPVNIGAVDNESSFVLELTTAADTGFANIVQTLTPAANATGATFTNLTPGTAYIYRGRSIGDGVTYGTSGNSSIVAATTTAVGQLNAPVLVAGTPTPTTIPVTWADVANESSYVAEIAAAADTNFTSIIQTLTPAAGATSATFTGLSNSTAYRMRIRAIGDGVSHLTSNNSTAVTSTTTAASTQLTTPTGLAAGTPTPTTIPITWNDVSNESSYVAEITTNGDTGFSSIVQTLTPAANANSATFTGLTPNTAYRFRIRAIGNGTTFLNSNNAAAVMATTAQEVVVGGPFSAAFTAPDGTALSDYTPDTGTITTTAGTGQIQGNKLIVPGGAGNAVFMTNDVSSNVTLTLVMAMGGSQGTNSYFNAYLRHELNGTSYISVLIFSTGAGIEARVYETVNGGAAVLTIQTAIGIADPNGEKTFVITCAANNYISISANGEMIAQGWIVGNFTGKKVGVALANLNTMSSFDAVAS